MLHILIIMKRLFVIMVLVVENFNVNIVIKFSDANSGR